MVGYPAWVRPNKSMDKLYGVSAVFSARNSFPGHPLRHELWRRQNEITIPKFFYAGLKNRMPNVDYSKGLVLNPDHFAKEATMKTMYHIAIDCFEKDNLFTEKLTDPLISFTVPIYWGCRNIDKYFDTRGIIQVNSVDEIIEVCNNLPHEHSHKTVLAMYENYERAVEISDYPEQLKRTINKILNVMKFNNKKNLNWTNVKQDISKLFSFNGLQPIFDKLLSPSKLYPKSRFLLLSN
jgi:hypothetical protein